MATYNGHNEDSSGNILLSIGNGMTATLETGTTASQAYSKGAYVFFNNRLCKVTAAITSGETLEIGTNLLQTTLGNELTSHLRASDGTEFYFDVVDNKPGYYPSATKTVSEFVPFKGSTSVISIGSGSTDSSRSFNCTSISNYNSLTNGNFLIVATGIQVYVSGGGGIPSSGIYGGTVSYSYNASTGILTVYACYPGGTSPNETTGSWVGRGSGYVNYTIYCIPNLS